MDVKKLASKKQANKKTTKNNTNKSAINDSKGNSIGTFSPSRLFEGMDYINNFVINKGVLS